MVQLYLICTNKYIHSKKMHTNANLCLTLDNSILVLLVRAKCICCPWLFQAQRNVPLIMSFCPLSLLLLSPFCYIVLKFCTGDPLPTELCNFWVDKWVIFNCCPKVLKLWIGLPKGWRKYLMVTLLACALIIINILKHYQNSIIMNINANNFVEMFQIDLI
jgi:hypothetical protein